MNLIFLLLLATLLLIGGCNGRNDSKKSDKVPKKSEQMPKQFSQMPKQFGQIPPIDSGKKLAQVDDGSVYFLFENYGQKILGQHNKLNDQFKKLVEGLNKKQCLLEAVFDKNSKKNIYSDEKEFKFFKNRVEEIDQNDPALSQLLEGLFAALSSANEAMKKDNANKLSAHVKKLKQSLAYAVFFMAKRGQIPLESTRGEKKNESKAMLIELINTYNELQLDIEKEIKVGKKSTKKGKGKNEQKGREEKGKKERCFLHFVARSLEIEWDANAFYGQNGDDDDDDAIGLRRRRRRKRMDNNFAAERTFYKEMIDLATIFLVMAVIICFMEIEHRARMNYMRGARPNRLPNPLPNRLPNPLPNRLPNPLPNRLPNRLPNPLPNRSQSAIDIFNALDQKPYVANDEEGNSCPICIAEIKPGTMVKPLPCNHIFHNECISSWLSQHNTCPSCRYKMTTR